MRRLLLPIFILIALAMTPVGAATGSPLETTDFGEGVFAPEPEFNFKDQAMAAKQLLTILEESPDMAKHLRAIRAYRRRLDPTGETVPRLRELVVALRDPKRDRAKVETAFVIGLLIQEDGKDARAQYIKDLVPLLAGIKADMPTDPWAHLIAAMLYGSVSELKGNWFDEALYAMCHGYEEAPAQLAVGSFLLAMDLGYGGNERLQWVAYLAMTRAQVLSPSRDLTARCKALAQGNMEIPGYRPSKWLKMLAAN
jgi:hypothetical protein